MGNIAPCPTGFEMGVTLTCHASCPSGYKYLTGALQGAEKCIHQTRNGYFIPLGSLPPPLKGQPIPPVYATEKARVDAETIRVNEQILSDETVLREASMAKSAYAKEFSKIRSDYAEFNARTTDGKAVKELTDSLKPLRPPTAPATDLEAERKQILSFEARSLLFIQIALALVVLTLVGYMLLPASTAHSLAFLLLCVAISFGFFLRR